MAMEFNIFAHKRASLKLRELHDGKGKPDSVCMFPNLLLAIGWARLQQCVNRELSYIQAGFSKAEKPDIKLPTSAGSWKKQESSRKSSISALLTMPKPLTVWITINCGKFFKRREYQTT